MENTSYLKQFGKKHSEVCEIPSTDMFLKLFRPVKFMVQFCSVSKKTDKL